MLALLLESALRSLALGVAVWLALALLRVRNPRAHMTAWTVVLVASLAMPVLMHRLTVTIPAAPASLMISASGCGGWTEPGAATGGRARGPCAGSAGISACSDCGPESVDDRDSTTRSGERAKGSELIVTDVAIERVQLPLDRIGMRCGRAWRPRGHTFG
jgi:hypothetical protein